jgi:hypothetical protein
MLLTAHLGMNRLCRDVRTRWLVMVLVVAFLALGAQRAVGESPSSTPRPASPALRVGFLNGLLSIHAKDGPWEKVLDEVRAKTGIILRVSMPLEGSVTVSFRNLPVEQALRRLFGPDANFAILYANSKPGAPSAAIPSEVWVLSKGSVASANTPHEGQEMTSSVPEGMNDPIQAIEREFETSPRAALDAAIDTTNEELRLKAVAHLAWQPNEEVVGVLLKFVRRYSETPIGQTAGSALEAMMQNEPQARALVAQELETTGTPEMWQWAAEKLGVSMEGLDDEPGSQETHEGDAGQERSR